MMNYTEEILKILSTELVPYSTVDGQACIDGVLTSAQKLNEFIQQLLQQTPCTTLLPLAEILPIAEKRLRGMRQHSKDGNPEYHYLTTDLYEDVEDVIKLIYDGQ